MKNYLCLFMLVILVCLPVFAATAQNRDYRIGIHTGYGSYELGQVKRFEKNISSSTSWVMPLTAVQEMPAHINYGLSVSMNTEKHLFGAHYNFHSTGSRYHYGDYSGETGMNSVVKANYIGVFAAFNLISSAEKSYQMYAGLATNAIFGSYRIDEFLRIPPQEYQAQTKFTHRGIGAEMFLKLEKDIGRLIVALRAGYDNTLYSRMYYKGEVVYLASGSGGKSSVKWSGFRTGLALKVKI